MMFVGAEAHLSGTKRVVLCDARNETKRGMPGQPKLQGKQGCFKTSRASQWAHVLEEGKQVASMGHL